MAKNANIDKLPKGPWLSEEEIQAILGTNADEDFERLSAWRSKPMARLWHLAAAASIAAIAFMAWPKGSDDQAVAYIYGNRVDNEQVAIGMMHATLAEALTPPTSLENELENIMTP